MSHVTIFILSLSVLEWLMTSQTENCKQLVKLHALHECLSGGGDSNLVSPGSVHGHNSHIFCACFQDH